jgi:3-hydroxypropionyl-CoA synthetase (ADP-forming)
MDLDRLLESYGFVLPERRLATTSEEAASLGADIGFPLVLKVASPDILHKTDIGGVELDIRSAEQIRSGYRRILAAVQKNAPDSRVDGVWVEAAYTEGVEIFIGLEHNQQFGPTIVFGLGGVFAEVLSDVTFRVLPISREDAAQMLGEIVGKRILEGYRGLPAASSASLIDLLESAGKLAVDHADRLEAIDLNPVLVHGERHCVLDAKGTWTSAPRRVHVAEPSTAYLDRFFESRSVAVIGASPKPEKIGYAILHSLLHLGYRGKVYPIHPTEDEIMGEKAYPSVRDVPDDVELAVAAIPLGAIPMVLDDLAEKGMHNLVIVSGGGKELGDKGSEIEAAIREKAVRLGIRIVGPNCIGVFDGETRLDTFFQLGERMPRPQSGRLAVLTQSGTVGAAVLEASRSVGISRFVSYGNRIDVDEADLLTYLANDSKTGIIACYIEGLSDGRKFLGAARMATTKKPIVVYKAGRTPEAATAAVSHTGFFGGTYGPWAGAFRQAGVIAVDSAEELIATAKALALQPAAEGGRVAMISNGAGPMIQAIDLHESSGLCLAQLAEATRTRLSEAYPPYFVVRNPIDVTGSGTAKDYAIGLEALLGDPDVDIVMPWFVFQDPALGEGITGILRDLHQAARKPILCGAMGGGYTERMATRIEGLGVPVFRSVSDWVAAAAGLAQWGQWGVGST